MCVIEKIDCSENTLQYYDKNPQLILFAAYQCDFDYWLLRRDTDSIVKYSMHPSF